MSISYMRVTDMARPFSKNRKDKKIELRVNQEQKEKIKNVAKRFGKPTATWLIEMALTQYKLLNP
jgi:predicted DNA binding CopG/RHH family protein